MLAGPPADVVLVLAAVATVAANAVALRPPATVGGMPPGPVARGATAAGIVGCIGLLIVADSRLHWTAGTSPALLLLPSTAASLWGGHHLWGFQREIARSLAGVSALGGGAGASALRPLGVLVGAVGRLIAGTTVLSAALALAAPAIGVARVDAGILAAFGLLALATLLVSLLEAVGRGAWALAAVGAALAAEAAAAASDAGSARPLVAGAAAAGALAPPPAGGPLVRPPDTPPAAPLAPGA